MKKLQGKLVAGLATVAFLGVLGSAQAQPAGAPPVVDTAAPPTPMMATPAPIPMASDNMSGQIGFGVGVGAGTATSLVRPNDTVAIKYWLSDNMALMAQLLFNLTKVKDTDMSYNFAPGALFLYSPWKVTSTRLQVGAGLGFNVGKNPPANADYGIAVPIYAGVEHFFAKWFSMGIAAQDNFISYAKTGATDSWRFAFDINSTSYWGSLFFYTD